MPTRLTQHLLIVLPELQQYCDQQQIANYELENTSLSCLIILDFLSAVYDHGKAVNSKEWTPIAQRLFRAIEDLIHTNDDDITNGLIVGFVENMAHLGHRYTDI